MLAAHLHQPAEEVREDVPQAVRVDGVMGGTETDTDCGGTCPSCTAGRKCLVNSDCVSSICLDTKVCSTSTPTAAPTADINTRGTINMASA